MSRRPIVETTRSGENYLHRTLWQVVIRSSENAAARPQGARYDHLAAMVFTFHTFEAYINFLGDRLAQDLWKREKTDRAIRSFEAKRSKVYSLAGLSEPGWQAPPYSTVDALKELRDAISHGKIETHSPAAEVGELEEGPLFWMSHVFAGKVTPELAEKARNDVHQIARELHGAARTRVRTQDGYGDDPFEGLHSQATHGQRLVGWRE